MRAIEAFGWRKLSPTSQLEHSVDDYGRLVLRSRTGKPPFDVANYKAVPLEWKHEPCDGDAWTLRTRGRPSTVTKLHNCFAGITEQISNDTGVDQRILLVQSACEARYSAKEACGKDLKSPRTEIGYPGRTGENDFGDPERDYQDWVKSHGSHHSHGLTQCLISTATGVRPDLFKGVDPRKHREILWKPENAYACIAAMAASYSRAIQTDPLAMRAVFGAGSIKRANNLFGVVCYNSSIFFHWLAFWNDLQNVLAAQSLPPAAA